MSARVLTLEGTGFQAGDVLLGKYRVDRLLGKGGMGFVLAATHLGLDQRVAIKMLLPACSQRVDVVARFSREARSAAKLKNEHVVRVNDIGVLEDGAPYMVMEYLIGRDLEAILAERGALPVSDAVEFVLEACEALAEAHAGGIVHRDLKPGNLFIAKHEDGSEHVKLLDFGISKIIGRAPKEEDEEEESLTGNDVLMGSPRYMAPEQLRSARDVDFRADLWSLGVILYQLISNALPFPAETAPKLIAQIATDDPIPLDRVKSGVPAPLQKAIERCLEKNVARRFGNVRELVAAIALFAPGGDVRARVERIDRAAAAASAPIADEPIPVIERVALRVAATQSSFSEAVGPVSGPSVPLAKPNGRFSLGLVFFLLASMGATAGALWHVWKMQNEVELATEALVERASAAFTETTTVPAPVLREIEPSAVRKLRWNRGARRNAERRERERAKKLHVKRER